LGWHYQSKISAKATKLATAVKTLISASKPQKPTKAAPVVPTINLQNISLEQKDNLSILDFVLTSPVEYYVEHLSDEQIIITLNNTGLLGNLPIELEDSFIASLNTIEDKNNTVITLNLLPGTKIEDLQFLKTPKPHLHLALSNSQLTETQSSMSKVPIPISPEEQSQQQYLEIQELLAQDKIPEAITNLHLFVGDFPDHTQAREILVALLIKDGRLQKANEILAIGLNRHSYYVPFIKLKAHILVKQDKTGEAINLLQKYSSNIEFSDIEYFALLASLYQQQGQFMEAANLYNQLTKIQPQKTIWWIGLGSSLENAGQKNAAQEAYHKALNNSAVPPDLVFFLNDKLKK
jgi:predicted Zn-dependent protease